jgi:Secretion system C-terminal sorting domain
MVKTVISFVFLFVCHSLVGQVNFYKKYSGNGYDISGGVVQLADSSYAVTGQSTSFFNGPPQAFIMKLDKFGNHQWAKHYGGLETEFGKRIFVTENTGYFIAGHTNSKPAGDFDFYMAHTDMSGVVNWEKSYGTSSWDLLNDAIRLSDSSYVLVGDSYNPIDGARDGYIVRLNKFGDTLWTKKTGQLHEDTYADVENYFDTAFVVGGKVWNADSSMFKAYLACYKVDGNLLWEKQYGQTGNYQILSMTKRFDNIIAVGGRLSMIDTLDDDYALRVDSQGNQIYGVSYYTPGHRNSQFIMKYGTGNRVYVVTGNDDQFTTGAGQDLFIGEFDDFMGYQNTGVDVDGSFNDFVGEMITTSDNGTIVVGTNNDFKFAIPSLFVLKIGANQAYPSTVGVLTAGSLVSVQEETFLFKDVKIYPNPATNKFRIELIENNHEGIISIVAVDGSKILSKQLKNNYLDVSTESFKAGLYFVNFTAENGLTQTLGKVTIY